MLFRSPSLPLSEYVHSRSQIHTVSNPDLLSYDSAVSWLRAEILLSTASCLRQPFCKLIDIHITQVISLRQRVESCIQILLFISDGSAENIVVPEIKQIIRAEFGTWSVDPADLSVSACIQNPAVRVVHDGTAGHNDNIQCFQHINVFQGILPEMPVNVLRIECLLFSDPDAQEILFLPEIKCVKFGAFSEKKVIVKAVSDRKSVV